MQTSNDPRFLPSLTGLRAFAALAVLVHHARTAFPQFEPVHRLGEIGWLGVPLFFILSGFVLMHNFDRAGGWGDFVVRRLCRIYPLHQATLVVALALAAIFVWPIGGYLGTGFGTLLNALLLHDLTVGQPEVRQAWNGVSWSLSCEFCFYLAAPFLFRRLHDRPVQTIALTFAAFLVVLAAAAVAAEPDRGGLDDFLKFHPLPHFAEFALGAAGALLVRRGWTFGHPALGLALMAVPAAPALLFGQSGEVAASLTNYLFVPGAFLLIVSLGARDVAGKVGLLHRPALVRAGEASFALYMTHAMLLWLYKVAVLLFAPWLLDGPVLGSLAMLGYVACALFVASQAHVRFELPANRRLLAAWRASRAQRVLA